MILQRLASAIRHQNWSQIIIEILIVVIGIFLGLQVTEWNDTRISIERERVYLNQLHDEIISRAPSTDKYLNERRLISRTLIQTLELVRNEASEDKFLNIHCNAISASHKAANLITPLNNIDELSVTGRSLIIRNSRLRNIMTRYTAELDFAAARLGNINGDTIEMTSKYPEIIKLGLRHTSMDLRVKTENICDVNSMKRSVAFKNDLVNNSVRYELFVDMISSLSLTIQELHNELDFELGILHSE